MKISVIIRTHNPRPDYLKRVLGALSAQTLPKNQWELLLVDNASTQPLSGSWDLSWHANGRHVREEELGQAVAGRRGIKESVGEYLVFVDDDNVLPPRYLECALSLAIKFPQLGSFGAGKIRPEFEVSPIPETAPYLSFLTIRDEKHPAWANFSQYNASTPWGAGLCFQRKVGVAYAEVVTASPVRRLLGRRGQGWMLSCEDVDMCLFACKLGLGTGVFPELELVHLIPARRLEKSYILSVAQAHAAAQIVLARLWEYDAAWKPNSILAWLRHIRRLLSMHGFSREVYLAQRQGESHARKLLATSK